MTRWMLSLQLRAVRSEVGDGGVMAMFGDVWGGENNFVPLYPLLAQFSFYDFSSKLSYMTVFEGQ
jgi:hypothetical protein